MKKGLQKKCRTETGFSVVELMVVLVIIVIMSAISIPYILNYRKLYRSEDQAIKMMDLMRETAQLALTRRRNMRYEIDRTANAVLVIDENGPGAADDRLIKSIPLDNQADVRFDVIPATVAKPNPPNYNDAVFAVDAVGHKVGAATVIGNTVWSARFRRDGAVVNAADVPISANLYVFPPISSGSTTARNTKEIRAITLFGGSGAVRYWKYDGTTFLAY